VSVSVSIFGLGYVGSVTAACLAHLGHRVLGVDVSPAKVEKFEAGLAPVLESRLGELISEARQSCCLRATTEADQAVGESDISFICVGTPSLRNGKLDLTHIERVCRDIGAALRRKKRQHTIVVRSTVLPGTTELSIIPRLESASGLKAGVGFAVCYNPEFMREGNAVDDFLHPPFTILGSSKPQDLALPRELYRSLPGTLYETSIAASEMVKYASNVFHALKISFANELGTLCKALCVDTEIVTRIMTSDTKLNISSAYLSPGFAFGGSCLPKDLRALMYRAKELDLKLPLLDAVLPSNEEHLERAVEMILQTCKRKVGMLGLSFKSATDDLRESPHVRLVKRLLGEGCDVRIWDKNVALGRLVGSNRQYIEETIPHIDPLLHENLEDAISGTGVVVIGTSEVEKSELQRLLKPEQYVVDLVNLQKDRQPNGAQLYSGICWK
jgi:GDP-mannose 6-dehydrogenase